jgi:hypothetical protein
MKSTQNNNDQYSLHRTFNPLVAGSNPARPTTKIQIGHATVFSKSLVGSSR